MDCSASSPTAKARTWVTSGSDAATSRSREIAERVHKEELGHAAFGYRLIRRYLQREGDRGRALLIKHLAKWYPAGLDMFGKSGSKRQFDYVRWGLRRRSNEADAR